MSGTNHNGFLKDFMNMRASLHKSAPSDPPTNKEIRAKKLAQKTNPTADNDTPINITLARIIEDKPKKKEVEAFFQQECDKLTKEKMK